MTTYVGTLNNIKIDAVKNEIWGDAQCADDSSVVGVKTDSGVSDQPLGWDETFRGAQNRANSLIKLKDAVTCIGIENGMVKMADKWFDAPTVVVIELKPDGSKTERYATGPAVQLPHIPETATEEMAVQLERQFIKDNAPGDSDLTGVLTNGYVSRQRSIEMALSVALGSF